MTKKDIDRQINEFCNELHNINGIYDDYARSVNIPYTNLYILSMISKNDECTQKIICERTFLPKQTVNAIITGFYKKGLVELRELPSDRRNKTIHLTNEGKEYIKEIISHIQDAEYAAMKSLSEEQRKVLIESLYIYKEAFKKAMLISDKKINK